MSCQRFVRRLGSNPCATVTAKDVGASGSPGPYAQDPRAVEGIRERWVSLGRQAQGNLFNSLEDTSDEVIAT